jgi:predicted MFS family arabinose efflux permease
MFSLTEISFNAGLMLGPLVCGSLSDAFGFEYTAWSLGEFSALFIRKELWLTISS